MNDHYRLFLTLHHRNNLRCYTRKAKAPIVKQVLHGYITCKIAKQGYTVISAVCLAGIAQRAHFFCIGNKAIKAFNPAACGSSRRRL